MKIDLNEIWNFLELAPEPKQGRVKKEWTYELVAGDVTFKDLSSKDILNLKSDDNYDTELLPSIFTFREILWQPNVYTQPSLCLPQLNILKVFCEEYIESSDNDGKLSALYLHLLNGLAGYCQEALDRIDKNESEVRISSILGDMRKRAFPLIKFFLYHPKNRDDYRTDATNRLNYAVKIMLTQYNNKYYDLEDPYWIVAVKSIKTETEKKPTKKGHTSVSSVKEDASSSK